MLVAALAAIIAAQTPWSPSLGPGAAAELAPDPSRDFSAAELTREDAFHRALRPASYTSLAVTVALALLLGLTPWGARLVTTVAAPSRPRSRRVVSGSVALAAVTQLATIPFAVWAETVLRRFGLSTQGWGGWTVDALKAFGLNTAILVAALLVLYALIRALPRWWWAPAAGGAFGLVVALSFVYPLVVEPVFNDFHPMPDGKLRSDLISLARQDRVPVEDVLVADASRRTTALNAYVSGFGATRRIVVYDTLLEQASPAEVRLIVAHELGHADREDVRYGTMLGALAAAAGVCALYLASTWPPLLRRAGVTSVGDPRSMGLILALSTAVTVAAGPVQNLVSRKVETRADVHSLDLTADPGTFVRMQRRLAVRNLSDLDPPPAHHILFASHPTAPERNALARRWAAVHGGPMPPPLAPGQRSPDR